MESKMVREEKVLEIKSNRMQGIFSYMLLGTIVDIKRTYKKNTKKEKCYHR